MRSKKKVSAIVQARMGSTRLPGKVLQDIGGASALMRVVQRVQTAELVDEVYVATTVSASDDAIVAECDRDQFIYFRESEHDVLDRYYRAAKQLNCEAVLRITSDCPLIDPGLVDQLIAKFNSEAVDFASNVAPRTYPRGLDAEVFTVEALERAWHIAKALHQREHVTPIFYERPDIFRTASVRGEHDYSGYRWTLDTPDDLSLIRAIYQHFRDRDFGWRDVVTLMEQRPELQQINAHVIQKSMHEVSPFCA